MNNKKIITFSAILIVVFILGFVIWGSKNKKNTSSSSSINPSKVKSLSSNFPIYFYGNTCPHCANVEQWMKKNNIEKKIKVIKKEVYNNKENAQELLEAAKSCGLSTDRIGVPFLYADEKCFIGTPDVIGFLSQKAGIEEKQ